MSDARAGAPRPALLLVLCLLVVSAVYLACLGAPFLWDDLHLVDGTAPLRDGTFRSLVLEPFWLGALAYFRPFTTLSFALDHALHGDNPGGYHLTNLLLHLGVTAALFRLLMRRGLSGAPAALLALGWALLPRLTEDVAWISGRTDVLAALFSLLCLCVYRPGSTRRLVLAALLALLALLAKEAGIAAFAALGWLELGALRRAAPGANRRRWGRSAAVLGAPLALYLALRTAAGVTVLGEGLRLSPGERALSVLEACGRYAYLLLNPFQPRSFMGRLGEHAWPFVALGALALAASLAGVRRVRHAGSETQALLLLAVVPLALVVHVFTLPVGVVASDRYLYLPSAALLLALAPRLQLAFQRLRLLLPLSAALVLALGVRTWQRVGDYGDSAAFWLAAVRDAPHQSLAVLELGSVAYRAGCLPEAYRLYLHALELDDGRSEHALDNAALIAAVTGRRELAAKLADELVRRYPRSPKLQLRRASIAFNALDFATARRHIEIALRLEPSFALARELHDIVDQAERDLPSVRAGTAPLRALAIDISALRQPEVVARLEGWLHEPEPDPRALLVGMEYVIAKCPPEEAARLWAAYRERFHPENAEQLAALLAERRQGAAELRSRLAAVLE